MVEICEFKLETCYIVDPDKGSGFPVRSGTGSRDVEHDHGRYVIVPAVKGRKMDHSTGRLSETVCEEHNYVNA